MPLDSTVPSASPLAIPRDKRQLVKFANDIVAICRTSAATRTAYCRVLNTIIETGRTTGSRALINLLWRHHARLASHLFSPTNLRFTLDFENDYPQNIQEMGLRSARLLTKNWRKTNADTTFGMGVMEALKFGAAIQKQWVENDREGNPQYCSSIVMPWQFGVYREDINELNRQPAMCETIPLTLPEVWKRIWHLPDAEKLFERIKAQSRRGEPDATYNSFFHQVLSTSTLDTGVAAASRQMPGGIVQLNNDPSYAIVGPQIDAEMVRMHELWVWGDEGWETIQMIEPDIIIAPLYKRGNLLFGNEAPHRHPYTLIQPNMTHGYIWGRPEVIDLMEPQSLLATWCDDTKRLFGLQVDKIIGFSGYDGLTDEVYDSRRGAGYFNAPAGTTITDLTPKMPQETLEMLRLLMQVMDMISGFDNILSGRGEQGVRAGVHADTLMKTASPNLRDRSLLVERQCAMAADLRLAMMQAKDGRNYWTDASKPEESAFTLHDIPKDRSVEVDSHSTSPIFADDHEQLIAFGLKAGYVDGESAIDMLPYPQKDMLRQRLEKKTAAQQQAMQQLMQVDPMAYARAISPRRAG